jgi:hypothetical protein
MGKMRIAAGNTKPKILISFTAMILEVIKQVIKMEATNKNQKEYRALTDMFFFGFGIRQWTPLEKEIYYYTEIMFLSIKIILDN